MSGLNAQSMKKRLKNCKDRYATNYQNPSSYFPECSRINEADSFVSIVEALESLLDLMFVGNRAYCFSSGAPLGSAAESPRAQPEQRVLFCAIIFFDLEAIGYKKWYPLQNPG